MLNVAVSMICVKQIDNEFFYLIQERTNKGIAEWKGTWEFPQGRLGDNQLLDFASFKFNNETGMYLDEILVSKGIWVESDSHEQIECCEPFIVVIAHGDIALHFFVRGSGISLDTDQAINHRWASAKMLEELLIEGSVCPLNIGAFESLVRMEKEQSIDKYLL